MNNQPDAYADFTPDVIRRHLNTLVIGRSIEVHRQVGSTNDLAKEAGRRGEPEGLVIAAEEQVAGRGRQGRTWTAPPGCCILCSVLLRPRFSPEHAFHITMAVALAIAQGIREWGLGIGDEENQNPPTPNPQSPIPTIKWPNDVLIGGRKVSGVLTESEFSGREWAFAVVGFGINANLSEAELGELSQTATSLSIETQQVIDRAALLARVLTEFEALYLALQNGQFSVVYDQWHTALETVGKYVTVRDADGTLAGRAVGVEANGALLLKQDDGSLKRVLSGDVMLPRDVKRET